MNEVLIKQRIEVYRILSQFYLREVDAPQLKAMKSLKAPEPCGNETWDKGWRDLLLFLYETDESCLEELAVDYARIFLSAGVAQGQAAFPYESVYTDRHGQLGGVPDGELSALYNAKGLKPSEKNFKVPNDHIGLEFAFMACLCRDPIGEQRAFLKGHLLNWYSDFCRDVKRYAHTEFYKAVAEITRGFMELESGLIEEGE